MYTDRHERAAPRRVRLADCPVADAACDETRLELDQLRLVLRCEDDRARLGGSRSGLARGVDYLRGEDAKR